MKRIEIHNNKGMCVFNVKDITGFDYRNVSTYCVIFGKAFPEGVMCYKNIREILQFIDDASQSVLIINETSTA